MNTPDTLKQSFKDHFKEYLSEDELERAFSLIDARIRQKLHKYTLPGAPEPTTEELENILREVVTDTNLRDKALKHFRP